MNKIIEAIKTMIANPEKITDAMKGVNEGHSEYFFLYDNKYKWSIMLINKAGEGSYYNLYYYPANGDIKQLAFLDDWDEMDLVIYKSKDFNSDEIAKVFKDLYLLVQNRAYRIDETLDRIIHGA